MSENKIETALFSTTAIHDCNISRLSSSNDDVFYSTPTAENCEIVTQINQRRNSDSSDRALVNWQEAHQRSSSIDTIDRLFNQSDYTNITYDPYAQYIQHHNNNQVTYEQNVLIRYLRPPTPPEPGPLIIREVHAPPPREVPPLIIHQRPHVPKTPPPIIIRERPPIPPSVEPPRIIHRYLPAPPPPPRKIIIQCQAPLPQKPQSVIIEKWLPYKSPSKRRKYSDHLDAPRVNIVQNIRHLGTVRADPHTYSAQYGSHLCSSEYVRHMMERFGFGNNYSEMIQMQISSQTSRRKDNHFQPIDKYFNSQLSMTPSSSSLSDEDQAEFVDEIITPNEQEEIKS
ncbi:hypothetical protein I4U23_001988 [Adineta vaga]|nr:hypothetical protein I4U23_001988 [Adineta vaga]